MKTRTLISKSRRTGKIKKTEIKIRGVYGSVEYSIPKHMSSLSKRQRNERKKGYIYVTKYELDRLGNGRGTTIQVKAPLDCVDDFDYLKKIKIAYNKAKIKKNKAVKKYIEDRAVFNRNFSNSTYRIKKKLKSLGFEIDIEESPMSKSIYFILIRNDEEFGRVRFSDHNLNTWNQMPMNVIAEIISNKKGQVTLKRFTV